MITITLPRATVQQTLEALNNCSSEHGHRCNRCDSEVDEGGRVVADLRAALEQPEPEPVAWMYKHDGMVHDAADRARLYNQNQSALQLIQSIAYEPHELSLDKAYDQRNWMQKLCRVWLQQNSGENQ